MGLSFRFLRTSRQLAIRAQHVALQEAVKGTVDLAGVQAVAVGQVGAPKETGDVDLALSGAGARWVLRLSKIDDRKRQSKKE